MDKMTTHLVSQHCIRYPRPGLGFLVGTSIGCREALGCDTDREIECACFLNPPGLHAKAARLPHDPRPLEYARTPVLWQIAPAEPIMETMHSRSIRRGYRGSCRPGPGPGPHPDKLWDFRPPIVSRLSMFAAIIRPSIRYPKNLGIAGFDERRVGVGVPWKDCTITVIGHAARALPSTRRDNPGAAKATIVPLA